MTAAAIQQAFDLSGNGRHGTQGTSAARPLDTTDPDGQAVMRFDGSNDFLQVFSPPDLTNGVTVFIAYRVRQHVNGASGEDHENFWTFETPSAVSNDMQLLGRSLEADPLTLTRPDGGARQIAIWTAATGNAILRDRAGAVTDRYGGSFGTPAAVVLDARYNAGPFDHAEIDVLGTVGVNSALAAADQQKLIDWAAAKWAYDR